MLVMEVFTVEKLILETSIHWPGMTVLYQIASYLYPYFLT